MGIRTSGFDGAEGNPEIQSAKDAPPARKPPLNALSIVGQRIERLKGRVT